MQVQRWYIVDAEQVQRCNRLRCNRLSRCRGGSSKVFVLVQMFSRGCSEVVQSCRCCQVQRCRGAEEVLSRSILVWNWYLVRGRKLIILADLSG